MKILKNMYSVFLVEIEENIKNEPKIILMNNYLNNTCIKRISGIFQPPNSTHMFNCSCNFPQAFLNIARKY